MQFVSDDPEKSIKTFLLTAAVWSISAISYNLIHLLPRLLACFSSAVVQSLLRKGDVKQKLEVRQAEDQPIIIMWDIIFR